MEQAESLLPPPHSGATAATMPALVFTALGVTASPLPLSVWFAG